MDKIQEKNLKNSTCIIFLTSMIMKWLDFVSSSKSNDKIKLNIKEEAYFYSSQLRLFRTLFIELEKYLKSTY